MANGDVKTGTAWPAVLGTAPSYALVNKVTKESQPDERQSDDAEGQFYGGRIKKTKIVYTVEVELLEGGAAELEALDGTGDGTEADPRIDVKISEDNENPSMATVTAWYWDNTQRSYKV